MKENKLRIFVVGLALSLILSVTGCNWFGTKQPTPTKPNTTSPTSNKTTPGAKTPVTPVRPAPTKTVPGLTATDVTSLRKIVDDCTADVNRNDWTAATKKANELGTSWTKFKSRGMSATEMAKFDTAYAKLQKDLRAKNKTMALNDLKALKDAIGKMKT